jgi:hypothetical protein
VSCAVLFVVASAAMGDVSRAAAQVTAREELLAAQGHHRAGDNVEAAEGFLRAYALDPRAPFLHDAFLAWRAAGRAREALEALDRFLAAPEQATEEDLTRLRAIREELARLVAHETTGTETTGTETTGTETTDTETTDTETTDTETTGTETTGTETTDTETTGAETMVPSESMRRRTAVDAFQLPPVEVGAAVLGVAGAALVWALVENRVVGGIVSSRDAMCTFGPSGTSCPRSLDQEPIAREFALHRDLGWSALGVGVALGAIGGTLLGMSLSGGDSTPRVRGGCGVEGCSWSVRGTF